MVKITTCATSMPLCEEGQNCHRLHFPQIRSRWRLWRPEGRPLCRLLSKRPIITMVIFGPHQICIDFVFISIGTFLPEIPDGWFCVEWISQMGEFLLRTGFLCCISDEVSCYKYSFGQISGQIFVGSEKTEGEGFWQDPSNLQRNETIHESFGNWRPPKTDPSHGCNIRISTRMHPIQQSSEWVSMWQGHLQSCLGKLEHCWIICFKLPAPLSRSSPAKVSVGIRLRCDPLIIGTQVNRLHLFPILTPTHPLSCPPFNLSTQQTVQTISPPFHQTINWTPNKESIRKRIVFFRTKSPKGSDSGTCVLVVLSLLRWWLCYSKLTNFERLSKRLQCFGHKAKMKWSKWLNSGS